MTDQLPKSNYPLEWPSDWPRTKFRSTSAYRVTFEKARIDAHTAAKKFAPGYRTYALTANVPLRMDGVPLANQREPQDPGVAFWWQRRGYTAIHVIACDKWRTIRENYRAIGLAIESLAMLERSGASQVFERSVESFARPQLVAPVQVPEWFEALSMPRDWWPPTREQVESTYKLLAFTHHPDRGGNPARMLEINLAYEQADNWLHARRGQVG